MKRNPANKAFYLMQNSAFFLWLALSLQLITKPSLSFAQVNAALCIRKTIMGYFDGLTNGMFKKDKNGNTVFYPWGVLGRGGRILPDKKTEEKVRSFVRRYYQVMLPTIIGVNIIFGWLGSLLLIPIFVAWFYFGIKALASGLTYSEEKLTLKEGYANSAKGYNKFTLWLLLIFSIMFVPLSIWIIISADHSEQVWLGWVTAILFSAASLVFGYMLKVKYA